MSRRKWLQGLLAGFAGWFAGKAAAKSASQPPAPEIPSKQEDLELVFTTTYDAAGNVTSFTYGPAWHSFSSRRWTYRLPGG